MKTRIAGIPCEVELTYYVAPRPMEITGTGFGDAIPPELEEIEFKVLDRKGYPAPWLEAKLADADVERIESELSEPEEY